MLADDFAQAVKIETLLKVTEERAEAAFAEEKALEKDRKNRRFFGLGPLRKDILSKIGDSQYQRDCMYEDADRYRQDLKALRQSIANQETEQANTQATTDMIETLGRIGSRVAVSVLKPLQFKPRALRD